jgi:hypothetical protein
MSNNEMPASSTNIGMLLHRQRDEPNQVQEQQFLATSAKTAKLYMDKLQLVRSSNPQRATVIK